MTGPETRMHAIPADPAGPAPNCWKCRHLAFTYEPRLPYLCRLLGIRTRSMPSVEVLRADGRPCAGFQPRPGPGAQGRPGQGAR